MTSTDYFLISNSSAAEISQLNISIFKKYSSNNFTLHIIVNVIDLFLSPGSSKCLHSTSGNQVKIEIVDCLSFGRNKIKKLATCLSISLPILFGVEMKVIQNHIA